MYPLIEIKTVPIEIQMKTKHAEIKYASGSAELEVSTDSGGLKIKSRPIKVNIDTFEARNSIVPTTVSNIEQAADNGIQSAYEATSATVNDGKMLLKAKVGQNVTAELAKRDTIGTLSNVNVKFLPDVPPEISFEGGDLSIQYEMDKLNFDWRMNQFDMEFTPGDIEFTVTQQPEIIINYVGSPIYVPPSSAPDYEPKFSVEA